jgi:adhesin transport system outer membrane protein
MFRSSLIALCCAMASTCASNAETIAQSAQWAIQYHPDVRILDANRGAIREELNAARGLALPGVRIEGNYGIMGTRGSDPFGTGDIAIKLRQPIYKGGKLRSERQRQQARVASADNRLADTVDTVALQAIQAYFEVVRSGRVLTKSRRNLNTVQGIVHRVRNRVSGGLGNQADLAQAEARLSAAHHSLAIAEAQREEAFALYLTAVGRHPGKLEQADLPKHALPATIGEILALSQDASPKLAAIRFDAAAATAAVATAQAELRPQLDVELSSGLYGRRAGNQSHRVEHRAMLEISWSLFNGGINRARVREAKMRAQEAEAQIETAALSLDREIRLAWSTYRQSGRQVQHLLDQSRINARLRDIRMDQYDAGSASLIAILDAQNESFVAGIQATNVYNSGRFAFYKLLAASGLLARTLDLPRG